MRTALALALAALMLAPTAAAWPWDPVTITVADSRVGDQLRFALEEVERMDGEEDVERSTVITLVEARGRVADGFGVERDVDTHVIQRLAENGTVTSAVRCHGLSGGEASVAHEPLDGRWTWGMGDSWRGGSVAGIGASSGSWSLNFSTERVFSPEWACDGRNFLAGRSFQEGDRVRLGDFSLGWDDLDESDLSYPAEATTFHERDALLFRFDLRMEMDEGVIEGAVRVILADGLPGVAEWSAEARGSMDGAPFEGRFSHALVGIQTGDGAVLDRMRGATLPERHPDASFEPWASERVPSAPLALAFPFEDALAAMRADPERRATEWLDEHPDAFLAWVWYSRDVRTGGSIEIGVVSRCDLDSDGVWWLGYADGAEGLRVGITRCGHGSVPEPLRALAPPALTTTVWVDDMEEVEQARPEGLEIADAETLARAIEGLGIGKGEIASFAYGASMNDGGEPYAYYTVATVDSNSQAEGVKDGLSITIDPRTGGAYSVQSIRRVDERSGFLDPLTGDGSVAPQGDDRLSALSALAGPGVGAGLGVGAAAGVALLVIALKFLLVPLFTRLARDRLLDNPVRARLYERIRAEPGIHRAELVEYAAIGEGATRHHVEQLVKHKLVVQLADGGFVRYYAAGEVPPEFARREAVLRAGRMREVYELLAREPSLTLREAGARLGMSAPSVHRAKKKLEKAGLLPAGAPVTAAVAEA